ncbi:hypothetical protein PHYPSEUDO_013790 [Phytophthora pseudosyringae]|uniref:RxLR effector protein n=1 Tax=Phytophthora pseudosyringae TaxID=221518 RepID=A0A8T1V4U6_9STRA|nr:hypothetical protein PHYPSEUDO_013790 [Phytophthora pseudosyringae]
MRISYVFVVITAAFLATSEALADTNAASISKVASPSGPNQCRLRSHHTTAADEEERLAPIDRINSLARKHGLDVTRAMEQGYLSSLSASVLKKYQKALNKLNKEYKSAKASLITTE